MIRHLRIALLALLALLLAACASGGRLVSAADGVRVFDLQFDTSMDWARMRASRAELWTIDGLPLNQFVVVSKVRPDEHVFLEARERKRRRDVLLDALRQDGWTNVVASKLRPARFGSVDGLRFDVQLTHQNGLLYRGTFAAAERGGKLTHFFWIAPAEYYYGRDVAAVTRMFDSARFVD